MTSRKALLVACAGCLQCGGAGPSSAPAPPPVYATTLDLSASDGLHCHAYAVWNQEPVTDVFLWLGGTGTGSSAFVPGPLQAVLRERAAAFVTFDHPGVTATFGDPTSKRIDDAPFRAYTQGTLVDCAAEAMKITALPGAPELRWHLGGHSEGALVQLALVERLHAANDLAKVKTVVLTGLPLEPFGTIVERQLAAAPKLAQAVAACDWPTMREALGISCAYIDDARKRPSGRAMFERIAGFAGALPFRVWQGEHDENTPAPFVHDLEAWNAASGHLDLAVRYYDGGHGGTPEARNELSAYLLTRATKAPPAAH